MCVVKIKEAEKKFDFLSFTINHFKLLIFTAFCDYSEIFLNKILTTVLPHTHINIWPFDFQAIIINWIFHNSIMFWNRFRFSSVPQWIFSFETDIRHSSKIQLHLFDGCQVCMCVFDSFQFEYISVCITITVFAWLI